MFQTARPQNSRVVLSIGGLDPSGGAGILLDAGAIRAAGAHPAAVVTVHTLQDGGSFAESSPMDADLVSRAVQKMLGNPNLAAIKIGALCNGAIADKVASDLKRHFLPPVVLDPVIATSTGGRLIDDEGFETIKARLMNQVTLITPNIPEAELLTGIKIHNRDDAALAAKRLVEMGAKAVLVKGGHLNEHKCVDILMNARERFAFESPRLPVGKVRGTGCGYSSLIAAFLGEGMALKDAVPRAREILLSALEGAVHVGFGAPALGPPIGPAGVDQNREKL